MAKSIIPTIDLSPFFNKQSNQSEKKEIIKKIKKACTLYGFFQVENHGVSASSMKRAFEVPKMFFDCSGDVKLKFSPAPDAPLPAGYFKQPSQSGDKNEFVLMFTPGSGFNVYPTHPPHLKYEFFVSFSFK
ncbi:hypothetical protein RND81_13G119200 [Saponaria officinalis]|uniref:Non-haem dioxygenase N-terminal domain-containing protein n=1 Tax=Saponaria officinalis TaxID=3572 RepID=A0AAW1H352_SAPOF